MSKDKTFVLTHPECSQGAMVLATRDDLDVAKTLGRRYGKGTVITCYVEGNQVSVPWVLAEEGKWIVKD